MPAKRGRMLDKISKISWFIRGVKLPTRQAPAYFNFCIHAERIYDDAIFEELLKFSKDFNSRTGNKIAACIMTPHCPEIRRHMEIGGFSNDEFKRRVLALSAYANVGYHGHFYFDDASALVHISHANYERAVVEKQIDDEMEWFKDAGIAPKIYTSGRWFLNKDIISKLEAYDFQIDLSIRKGKADTAGGRYLEDKEIPKHGHPFVIPPSKNMVEIQSIFGPNMPPFAMKGHLFQYVAKDMAEELFFIFPLHDWDLPKSRKNIWANIEELCRSESTVRWMDVFQMRDRYLSKQGSRH